MATPVQRLGSCMCKRVRFTVAGEPFQFVVLTEGADLVRKYEDNDTTSGNTLTRSFCSECGSSLFLSSPTKTDWISVCPAAIDDDQSWGGAPRREVPLGYSASHRAQALEAINE
ncbi:hypothetical protein C8R47DRAFT_496558 [Mycena vitilis]|nr:hypothetical protein C8R47DRAFT_496558 [Mycena vitilis]